jgi:hypothetical protein
MYRPSTGSSDPDDAASAWMRASSGAKVDVQSGGDVVITLGN